MSLDPDALADSFEAMSADLGRADDDEDSVWFERDMSAAGAAALWADALGAYAAGVVPASTTIAAARAALETALAAAFATPAAAAGMETAFAAFATTVGGGMAGAGFTGVPPVAPVGFATLFAGAPTDDPAVAAAALADLIHAWLTTGSATLIAPPNTVSPWA